MYKFILAYPQPKRRAAGANSQPNNPKAKALPQALFIKALVMFEGSLVVYKVLKGKRRHKNFGRFFGLQVSAVIWFAPWPPVRESRVRIR